MSAGRLSCMVAAQDPPIEHSYWCNLSCIRMHQPGIGDRGVIIAFPYAMSRWHANVTFRGVILRTPCFLCSTVSRQARHLTAVNSKTLHFMAAMAFNARLG